MTVFGFLSDAQLVDIIAFLDKGPAPPAPAPPAPAPETPKKKVVKRVVKKKVAE